jgi:hypothetical protein
LESVPDKRMRNKPTEPPASLFGQTFVRETVRTAPEPYHCPLSAIIGTAVLGESKRGDKCAAEFGKDMQGLYTPRGFGSRFTWGWPLLDIEPVVPPYEIGGRQGFWEWSPSASEAAA